MKLISYFAMNKFDVFLNPPYKEILAAIKPKSVDFGNNNYYAVIFNGAGVMLTIPKTATPEKVVQIMATGINSAIQRSKDTLWQRIKAVFTG